MKTFITRNGGSFVFRLSPFTFRLSPFIFNLLPFLILAILINITIAQDVNTIIKRVQKTYDRMDNFSATFVQVDFYKLTQSRNETSGKIYVQGGEKYRFETEDQVVVTDGKNVWTHNRISGQVLIDKVREDSGALLPRDLIFKYPKTHYATLVGKEKAGKNEIFELKLTPKDRVTGFVKAVKLWVLNDEWHVVKLETTDLNDNQTVFEIKDIDPKTDLSESLFSFQPDESMQVVDMR